MPEPKKTPGCAACSGNIPAYLDYILWGTYFPKHEEIESHLADCSDCFQEYNELLGMVLREKMEPLVDQLLEGERSSKGIGLLIELNSHWWELCFEIGDKAGLSAALSHLGILSELNGDEDEAIDYHHKAMSQQAEAGYDHYTFLLSTYALARLYMARRRWIEAKKYHQKFQKKAEKLDDTLALVRGLIQRGDFFYYFPSNSLLIKAVTCYKQANILGETTGYSKGAEIAEQRILQLKNSLNTQLQHRLGYYISGNESKAFSMEQLSENFAEFLLEELAEVYASKKEIKRADYTSGEYDISEIFSSAFSSFKKKDSIVESAQFDPGQKEDLLLTRNVLIKLMQLVQELGLSYHQAEELARYLQDDLTREMMAKPEFQKDNN